MNYENYQRAWQQHRDTRTDESDIIRVCPNCEQWQRRSNYGDCLNQCAKRGFAPAAHVEKQEPKKDGA